MDRIDSQALAPTLKAGSKVQLIDPHGRWIHKVRVSLLDACNMNCLYCMPEEKSFLPKKNWASPEELAEICHNLTLFGVDEVRITGGEPLLRSDFSKILILFSNLKLNKLGLTTNGIHLEKYLPNLVDSNLEHINLSLDSLDREKFHSITQTDTLNRVLHALYKSCELGFKVKINVVALKGLNDVEIFDFIDLSAKLGIEVRFLELMRIGVAQNYFDRHFISADQLIQKVKTKYKLVQDKRPVDSTSFNFKIPEVGGEIGFIASESKPFCGGCSRLRLGPEGRLRPCLFKDSGPLLLNEPFENYPEILNQVMGMKPTERITSYNKPMHQIGG